MQSDKTHRQRWHDYFFPNSAVLRNKKGITNADAWNTLEAIAVTSRTQDLPALGFDTGSVAGDLKAIHHHLFADCYEWAGNFRDVNMSKSHPRLEEPVPFLSWQTIEENLGIIDDQIQLTDWDNLSTAKKIDSLALLHGELNTVHPFREGNGRVTRIFIEQLAACHDITVSWEGEYTKEALHLVSAVSMTHESGLDVELWQEFYTEIAQESTWDNQPITGIESIFDVVDLSPTPQVDTSLLDRLGISASSLAPSQETSSTPPQVDQPSPEVDQHSQPPTL